MPRNVPVKLTENEYRRTIRLAHQLRDADGPVTLRYVKRPKAKGLPGEPGEITGTVHAFPGLAGYDTFSVDIVSDDPNRGIRTINLVRVKEII